MDDTNSTKLTTDDTVPAPLLKENLSETPNEAKTLEIIESAIKINISKVDRLKEDAKPHNEMLKSYLEGDEMYMKLSELAKEASTKKGVQKRELLATDNGKMLVGNVTEVKEDLKEAQEALSHYLREYQRLTGLNEFEGEDGELRQIVYTAKLVRKTNLNRD